MTSKERGGYLHKESRDARHRTEELPTLIWTLKRIASTKQSSVSPKNASVAVAQTPQDGFAALVYHDSQLRKTEKAAGAAQMNKKSSSTTPENTTPSQKQKPPPVNNPDSISISASANSDKMTAHSARKRKSSSVDEEVARIERARRHKRKQL